MDQEPTLDPVLVFDLPSETFGIRLGAVKEIHRPSYLQGVPLAPSTIRGVADVRGRMVTAVDLPALLAGQQIGRGVVGHLMILAEPWDHFGLWLHSDIDLRSLALGALEPRPGTEGEPEIFEGFVASEDSIVNLLSTEKLFLHCEQEVLRRYRVAPG